MRKIVKVASVTGVTLGLTVVFLAVQVVGESLISGGQSANSDSHSWQSLVAGLFMTGLPIVATALCFYRNQFVWHFPKQHLTRDYGLGCLVGAGQFALTWGVIVLLGGFQVSLIVSPAYLGWLLLFAAGFMVQGMSEEILCRGVILGKFLQHKLSICGVVVNTTIFAALHLANDGANVLAIAGLFLFGLTMSLLRVQGVSLWFLGAFHSAWNFAEGVIFGTSVSGMPSLATVIKSDEVANHPLLNGGTFGVEASVMCIVVEALVAITVLLYAIQQRTRVTKC